MGSKTLLSFICQGLMSAAGFFASFLAIKYATEHDYARYILFVATLSLLAGIQNAVFLAPTSSIAPKLSRNDLQLLFRKGLVVTVLLAVFGGGFFYLYISDGYIAEISLLSVLLVAFFLMLFRDTRRNILLLEGRLKRLALGDFFVLIAVIVSMVAVAQLYHFNFITLLICIAIPCALMLFNRLSFIGFDREESEWSTQKEIFKQIISCARWALPGVLVTWLFSSGYWFFLEHQFGVSALVILAGTRLFFTPIGLMVQGWANFYRPQFSKMESLQQYVEIQRLIKREQLVALVMTALVVAAIYACVYLIPQWIPQKMMGENWQWFVLLWGIYFSIQWCRTVLSTSLLSSPAGFKQVFLSGLWGCIIFYVSLILSSQLVSQIWICLLALIFSEIVIYILVYKECNKRQKV